MKGLEIFQELMKKEGLSIDPDQSIRLANFISGMISAHDFVRKERDEAIAKLAAMEAELYALKGQAAGVWDSVPADKPAVAVLEVTDYMVYAFHHALTDADIGENDFNCLKKGLEAALLAAPSHSQQSAHTRVISS